MKASDLPEWARIYKTKGHDVRRVGKDFSLYQITSKMVEGKNHPVLVQKYLGRITEKDGFIPARIALSSSTKVLEFGLTDFLLRNFKRELEEHIFNSAASFREDTIRLAIIYHVFGSTAEEVIRSTMMSMGHEDKLISMGRQRSRTVERLSGTLGKLFESAIGDVDDRARLTALLRSSVVESSENARIDGYPKDADAIIDKWGMRKWQKKAG